MITKKIYLKVFKVNQGIWINIIGFLWKVWKRKTWSSRSSLLWYCSVLFSVSGYYHRDDCCISVFNLVCVGNGDGFGNIIHSWLMKGMEWLLGNARRQCKREKKYCHFYYHVLMCMGNPGHPNWCFFVFVINFVSYTLLTSWFWNVCFFFVFFCRVKLSDSWQY